MTSKRTEWRLLFGFAFAKLAIHLATFPGYGYFRDEFYYLACSRRLDFGYVDHPPLSVLILWLDRVLLGDSLFALRLPPALAGAATVFLVGLLTKELGGRRWAQAVAMTGLVVAPIYLSLDHFYSMNAFDVLFWALSALLLTWALRGDRNVPWIWLGVALGLGLQNKISLFWLGAGLLVGLLLTPHRRALKTAGPWLAGSIAFLIFSPHLLWQVGHGWPTVEFIQNATSTKMASKSMLDFVGSQILSVNPLNFPIWLLGLYFLLVSPAGRPHRVLGWIYVTVFLLLAGSGTSRTGYLAPAYTWLLPAGGVCLEEFLHQRWARTAVLVLMAISGAVLAPFALPVLPVANYIDYARFMGIHPGTEERKELAELPQFFADMHGWEEIVGAVRTATQRLSREEKERAAILAPDYGVAGAIEHLGPDLPPVLSGHNNYWIWGPRGHGGEVMLIIGSDRETLLQHFQQVDPGATINCGRCMPYENHRPVWICRRPLHPLSQVWPRLKHFD